MEWSFVEHVGDKNERHLADVRDTRAAAAGGVVPAVHGPGRAGPGWLLQESGDKRKKRLNIIICWSKSSCGNPEPLVDNKRQDFQYDLRIYIKISGYSLIGI